MHADICDPMEENSIATSRYFLLFKDDIQILENLYFLKNKVEVKDCFKNFTKRIKFETRKELKTLRTDNSLEFINKDIKNVTDKVTLHSKMDEQREK